MVELIVALKTLFVKEKKSLMLDLTKNYCYDPVLRYQLKLLYICNELNNLCNKINSFFKI